MNRVLEQTTQAQLRLSEKMMKVDVAMKLGSESGKGAALDTVA